MTKDDFDKKTLNDPFIDTSKEPLTKGDIILALKDLVTAYDMQGDPRHFSLEDDEFKIEAYTRAKDILKIFGFSDEE